MNSFGARLNNSMNNVGYNVAKYWPQIGSGLGIFGLIASGIWGIAVTKPALKKIESDSEEKYGDPEAYTFLDAVKSGWRYYVGPAGLAVVSTLSTTSAVNTSIKRSAANYALYAIAEQQLREYVDKTEEIVGKKKAEEIKQAVAEEDYKRIPKNIEVDHVRHVGSGEFPWYDPISQSAIYTNKADIQNKINILNGKLLSGDEVSYDDFCDITGFKRLGGGLGMTIGWNLTKKNAQIEIEDYHPWDTEASKEDPVTGEIIRIMKFKPGHGPITKYGYDELDEKSDDYIV